MAPKHLRDESGRVLEDRIRLRATQVEKDQPGYHPIYGFIHKFPAKGLDLLTRNCVIVEQHLEHVQAKHQVRILEIGCNYGYVSFLLAEKFPNVVGLEIARDRLALCRDIAAYTESSARFFEHDFFKLIESGDADLENIDVVLLLNIVHQFIFKYGLSYTQALIARLARRVDISFVELARRKQFVKHKKGHLLPEDPEEVFKQCEDVEITLIEHKPRPLYVLRRKKVRIAQLEIEPANIDFSKHLNPQISRKYYTSNKRFVKLFRFTEHQGVGAFNNEVNSLLRMRDSKCAPVIYDWVTTRDFGAVMMSTVPGSSLRPLLSGVRLKQFLYRPQFRNRNTRYKMTRQYLHFAKIVHERIGFHNDMQPHNMIVKNSEEVVLIDYEQAGRDPQNDPFGMLLWTLYDIWGGKTKSREEAILTLRLIEIDEIRPTGAVYPDFSELDLDDTVSALVDDALHYTDWGEFLVFWNERLSTQR